VIDPIAAKEIRSLKCGTLLTYYHRYSDIFQALKFPDPTSPDRKAADALWYPTWFIERQQTAPLQQEYEFQRFKRSQPHALICAEVLSWTPIYRRDRPRLLNSHSGSLLSDNQECSELKIE
jgi:hypothetical protein